MADLYESGLSLEDVGAEFGISKQRVDRLFKKFGVETSQHTVSKTFIAGNFARRKILPKEPLVIKGMRSKDKILVTFSSN